MKRILERKVERKKYQFSTCSAVNALLKKFSRDFRFQAFTARTHKHKFSHLVRLSIVILKKIKLYE